MYLVASLENNRVSHARGFDNWDDAVSWADEVVMRERGVTNEMPDWENDPVCECGSVAVQICLCITDPAAVC